MQKLLAVSLTISLFISTAAIAAEGSLAPGKPAGVHKAQEHDNTALLIILGVAAVGVGIGVAASGGSSAPTDRGYRQHPLTHMLLQERDQRRAHGAG